MPCSIAASCARHDPWICRRRRAWAYQLTSYAAQRDRPESAERRTEAAMTFVDVDRVSLGYGEDAEGTLALPKGTLQVGNGEFVAVGWASGCGKSTLMKVVTGLWPPTVGAVIVSGREVTGPLSIAGMAFQNPTLLPWRTTLANVMLPLEIVQPHCSKLRREWAAYLAKARDLL